MDGWENNVPHIHGGQRRVLGTFDVYSTLDRSYLMHRKSDAGGVIGNHLSWNHHLGVRYKRGHTDNAPDLIAGEAAVAFRRWGVHVTTSMPYEPRQNSQMERRWREKSDRSWFALEQSNFCSDPTGEGYWWYVPGATRK